MVFLKSVLCVFLKRNLWSICPHVGYGLKRSEAEWCRKNSESGRPLSQYVFWHRKWRKGINWVTVMRKRYIRIVDSR